MGESDHELSRREFLERSAITAGVAGAAASLPLNVLLSEASKAQASPLPSPRNTPIDHFVVVMMENRSFDHYFGWLSNVADATQHQTYTDPQGNSVSTRHASTLEREWQGCGHPDPGHGWESGRAQLQNGFLAAGSGNDEFALTYYDRGELAFLHAAARKYTLYDQFFCSLLASTWPNRYYKWSAQSGGKKDNTPPLSTVGNQWPTIFDRAIARGLKARYYNSDLPFSAVWGPRGLTWTHKLERFYTDCASGRLPHISFVDPPFRDGGGGDGLSADEHPHGDVRLGQAWMADVVRAFVNSPNYRRGALFVVYDEWGGFFDHARPPRVPDARSSSDLYEDFGQMGFRIPAVAISPYTARRLSDGPFRVQHQLLGFESILKLIEHRFAIKPLTTRDREAGNIGTTFNWERPNFAPLQLPNPQQIAAQPCSTADLSDESALAHESDLAALEGLAERFGFPVGDGKVDSLFTQPDALRKAVETGAKGA